jgi:hypothetical protein
MIGKNIYSMIEAYIKRISIMRGEPICAVPMAKEPGQKVFATVYQKLGNFPLYAFFLYSDEDKDVAEFMSQKTPWLHSLSNMDCLIYVFENPSNWPEEWKLYWEEMLDSDFRNLYARWVKMTPYSRTEMVYPMADLLGVEKKYIPCMVFVEDFMSKNVLHVPFPANKTEYHKYFLDLFTCVHRATNSPKGERLKMLHKEYQKIWIKWVLPSKMKDWAKDIQEGGSVLKETKDTLIQVFDPITPILKSFIPS